MTTSRLMQSLGARCGAAVRVLIAVLRELADESAYERHLSGSGRAHSGAEWRHFQEEALRRKYRRPKCC